MKAFIYIALFSILTSCGLFKHTEVIRDHTVRDSIIVTQKVKIDTLTIKRDTFSGMVPFSVLQQLGELTFRGDRTTTKIIYRDGKVGFNTSSDSLTSILINRIDSLEHYRDSNKSESVIKIQDKKSNNWYKWGLAFLIVILLLSVVAYLIILKLKK